MDIQARKKAIGQLVEAMKRGIKRAEQCKYSYTEDEEEKLVAAFNDSQDLEAFANTVETQQLFLGNIADIQFFSSYAIDPASVEKLFGVGYWSQCAEDKQNFISEITREDQKELVDNLREVTDSEMITVDTLGVAFAEAGGSFEDNIPAEAMFVPEFVRGYIEYFSFEHQQTRKSDDEPEKSYIEELMTLGEYIRKKLENVQLRSEQAQRMKTTTGKDEVIESGRGA